MTEQLNIRYLIYAYTAPRLRRWVQVVTDPGGGGSHGMCSGIYRTGITSGGATRVEYSAQQTEEARRTAEDIEALPLDLADAIRTHYLTLGTYASKAEACDCSPSAFYSRVDRAHESLYFKWFGQVSA